MDASLENGLGRWGMMKSQESDMNRSRVPLAVIVTVRPRDSM